jgi:hypothetical protein
MGLVVLNGYSQIRRLKVNVACEQWYTIDRYGEAKMKDCASNFEDYTGGQIAMQALETQGYLLRPLVIERKDLHVDFIIRTRLRLEGYKHRYLERNFTNILECLRLVVHEMTHSGVTVALSDTNNNDN